MSINWDRLMTLDQFAPHEIAFKYFRGNFRENIFRKF